MTFKQSRASQILKIIVFVILISSCSPNFNKRGLKELIKNKAGIELDNINIKKYEDSGFALSDFAETYQINLMPIDYSKTMEQIQNHNMKKDWRKIERGYQLIIPQITSKDTIFIFSLDEKNKSLKIQIIEE